MLNNVIRETMENNSVAAIIISISIMLFLGFALTRITKKLRLPNVTAYILTGILIGPFVLDLIPQQVSEGMDFLSDIALAFIAFSTGEFFTFSNLKKNGAKVVIITVFEACLASVVVFIAVYFILGVDLDFAVVLSALASATAPASTMMTIRQTNARGNFVDTLLQTVALDDVIGLIEYSVAISVALALSTGKSDVGSNVILPILMNLGILVLGGLFGFILKFLMPQKRSTDNRLIISVSILFAFCGICALLDVSPLLGCVAAAFLIRIFALVFRRVIRFFTGGIAFARTSEIVRCQAVLKAGFIDKSYKFGVFVALFIIAADNYPFGNAFKDVSVKFFKHGVFFQRLAEYRYSLPDVAVNLCRFLALGELSFGNLYFSRQL